MTWFLVISLAGKVAAVLLGWGQPVAALALWFVPDLVICYHLLMPNAQGIVPTQRRFTTTEREVWLTIDDGPDPADTPRLLELLAAHGARVTFFVIGENAARHPDLVRAMVAGGHEVAHHTQTHPLGNFWCAGPRRLARELDDATTVLRGLGVEPVRFRSPAGIKNPWLRGALSARGLAGIGWSARGREFGGRSVDDVVGRVLAGLAPGAILLLHEGPRVPPGIRVEAVRRVLDELRQRGYRCVIPAPAPRA